MTDAQPRDPNASDAHPDLVVFRSAKDPFEARIIAAVLEDAGIPAYVAGAMLTDEFAATQRLMNLQGVDVQIPQDRVEEAEAAIAEAKRLGKTLTEDSDVGEGDTPPDKG